MIAGVVDDHRASAGRATAYELPTAGRRAPGAVPWRAASAVRGLSTHEVIPLDLGWELGRARVPGVVDWGALVWQPALVPGTAAASLRATGDWNVDRPLDLDAEECWWRCRFPRPAGVDGGTRAVLALDGVATVADVWLNGTLVAQSESMYVAHAADVTALLADENVLLVRCHALRPLLDARRGRPRWRTRLVGHQQLRWVRTTLLGRIPGWTPPAAPVGPWRPVRLELRRVVDVVEADVRAWLDGEDGVAEVVLRLDTMGSQFGDAALVVGGVRAPLRVETGADDTAVLSGRVRLPSVERWWPHTHGTPTLHGTHVELTAADVPVVVDLGRVGFRTLEAHGGAPGRVALPRFAWIRQRGGRVV